MNIGNLTVSIIAETQKFTSGLNAASTRMRMFAQHARHYSRLAGTAIAGFGIASVKMASDAEESLNRFGAVFGTQAEKAGKFADDLAKRIGRSGVDIKDALSSFQGFFVGLEFAPAQARAMSEQIQALALDFASFNNLSDAEASQRFISALSGSSEVLDKFGVNTKQAALETELLRQGIRKSWTDVTEQEKAVARLSIIMRSMTAQGAVGDAEKTAGSFANQMKRLQSDVRDLGIAIGRDLLPMASDLVKVFTELASVTGSVGLSGAGNSFIGQGVNFWRASLVTGQKAVTDFAAGLGEFWLKAGKFMGQNTHEFKEEEVRTLQQLSQYLEERRSRILGVPTPDDIRRRYQEFEKGRKERQAAAEAARLAENLNAGFAPRKSFFDTNMFIGARGMAQIAANKFGGMAAAGVGNVAGAGRPGFSPTLGGGLLSALLGGGIAGAGALTRAMGGGTGGMTPGFALTQSGSADSYRQQARISRQNDAMKEQVKLAKDDNKEQKKHTNLLENIAGKLGGFVAANL